MREIDDYLKKLYRHLNASDQEISELKGEMKRHLLESVHELEAEGNSPAESLKIAIERFGDPGLIGSELPKIMMVSRRRFSKLLLIGGGTAVVLVVVIVLAFIMNFNQQRDLQKAELIKQEIVQELQQSQKSNQTYKDIFDKTGELAVAFGNSSEPLSEKLKAKFNVKQIDQIDEMNRTFRYHNTVLIAVAVIAANTGYESPYFTEIAQLGVMKLSNSAAVIDLAEKAREAKTPGEREHISQLIEDMKETVDLSTYQEALDYNKKLQND